MADEATAARPWNPMERQIVGPDAGYGPGPVDTQPATVAPVAPVGAPDPFASMRDHLTSPPQKGGADPFASMRGELRATPQAAPPSKGILSTIKDAVVGKSEFDLPEAVSALTYSAPVPASYDKGKWDPGVGDRVAENINAKFPGNPRGAMSSFISNIHSARGEDSLVDVLKQYDPEVAVSQDKFGNKIVKFGDNNFYLNKSGLSGRDLQEGARDTMTALTLAAPTGRLLQGAHGLIRAGGQFLAGAAGSVMSDKISDSAGSQQGIQPTEAVLQGIGGVVGEVLGTAGGYVMARIRNAPSRYVNVADGTLTDKGAELFRSAGINPEDVTDQIAKKFAEQIKSTGPTAATARDVAAQEFNIPLSRGDATQDFKRQAFEQAAEANARGEWAGNVAREGREAKEAAIQQAKVNIGEDLGPKVTGQNPQENAASVLEGVRGREEAHGKVVSSAYEQAAEQTAGKTVPKKQLKTLPDYVDSALEKDGIYLSSGPEVYPAATAAKKITDMLTEGDIGEAATAIVKVKPYSYQRGAGPDMGVPDQSGKTVNVGAYEYNRKLGAVVLDSLETVRKNIAGKDGLLASAATPADRRAVRAVVRGYNEWLDNATDKALMTEGGEVVAQQIKNARAAASKHFSLFSERQSVKAGFDDNAGRTIERMINGDVQPNEIANWLWGSSKIGQDANAVRVATRIKEITGGPGSPEWDAMRRGMWQKIAMDTEGKTQPGAQAVSQNIFEFVNGKGKAMADTLFTMEEQAKMRRFAGVLRDTVPPVKATNRSGSGYEVARAVNDFFGAATPVVKGMAALAQGHAAFQLSRAGAPIARSPSPALLPAMGGVAMEQGFTGE